MEANDGNDAQRARVFDFLWWRDHDLAFGLDGFSSDNLFIIAGEEFILQAV
jgi:hypothetical protein